LERSPFDHMAIILWNSGDIILIYKTIRIVSENIRAQFVEGETRAETAEFHEMGGISPDFRNPAPPLPIKSLAHLPK